MGNKTISGKEFVKKLFSFSIATVVGFGISFFATPIITRCFSPEEMGKINLFMTYMNIIISVCYLGMDQTYVRFYNEPIGRYNEKNLITICLRISSTAAIIADIFILVFYDKVSFNIVGYPGLLIPLCLSFVLLCNMFLRYSNLKYRMDQKTKMFTIQSITLTLINKVLFVIAAVISPTHRIAIITTTLAYIFVAIVFIAAQYKNFDIKTKWYKKETLGLMKYGLPLMPVTLLVMLNTSLASLMLRYFVDYQAIGIYTSAVSVASVINLLQTGFNTYWTPFVYENYKRGNEKIKKVHLIVTFIMICFGICIVLGQDILYLLLGENFRQSKAFFPFLLMSPICYTIAETTGIGINIVKKSYLNIITFIANIGVNFLGCIILLPKIGVAGAAISSAIAALVMLIVKTLIAERYYQCITKPIKTFLPPCLMLVVGVINYMFFDQIFLKYLLIIGILCLLCVLFWRETSYLFNFIKNTIIINVKK